jgi:hypothetical protein
MTRGATAAEARPAWAVALLLAALVIAVWLPSLHASFQFDDWSVIVGDPRVQSFVAWWAAMPALRPLLKLVYALGNEAGGAPALFRGLNIALHAANTALVFVLTRRLARRLRSADAVAATRVGAITALVFGLHPVQTEAVTYVSGGSMVLSATAVLLCLAAFLRELDDERRGRWLVPCALALLAALAVRETAAVAPLALTLWWAAEQGGRHRAPGTALILLAALTVAALVAGFVWTDYPYLLRTSLAARAPLENLLVQTRGVFHLAAQLVRWDRLNVDPALVAGEALTPRNVLRAIVLLGVVGLAVAQWRQRRWLAFGVLWFLLWLAPTQTLLARLDLVNDRQLYLALLGPAFILAHLLQGLRAQSVLAAAVLAMLLATGTAMRNLVYADEVSFWEDVLAKAPHNARAANNLGIALAFACRPLAAATAFESAVRLRPDDTRARLNLELLQRGELPGVPATCPAVASPPR